MTPRGRSSTARLERGVPFAFHVVASEVIKGWDEGVARHEGRAESGNC